jgi:hypothetical protein
MEAAGRARRAERLKELEGIIERGLQTFIEVGNALLEIRDGRLYRESHASFEDYTQKRWAMSKPYAYRLIQAAEIAAVVPVGTESQARELAPLKHDPKAMQEAYKQAAQATSRGRPTARLLRHAVKGRAYALEGLQKLIDGGRPLKVQMSEIEREYRSDVLDEGNRMELDADLEDFRETLKRIQEGFRRG